MIEPIVDRVLRSTRYRDVDRALLDRLAAEELPKSRNADDAVKRVKRRLHQAVGAYRGAGAADPLATVRAAWAGDRADAAFRAACAAVHAGPRLDRRAAAVPRAVLRADLGADGRPAANAPRPRLRARSAGPALDGPAAGRHLPRLRGRSALARGGGRVPRPGRAAARAPRARPRRRRTAADSVGCRPAVEARPAARPPGSIRGCSGCWARSTPATRSSRFQPARSAADDAAWRRPIGACSTSSSPTWRSARCAKHRSRTSSCSC